MWCTSSHKTDGARTCEVGGSWYTDASGYGKTNKEIREMHKLADLNNDFFSLKFERPDNFVFGIYRANTKIFLDFK